MALVEFIHFCDYAFLDDGGHPCLIGIHGSLTVHVFPFSRHQLTIAVGLRLNAGEQADIRAELGPPDGPPKRAANFQLSGPPLGGPLTDGLVFLPFHTVALYFDRPQTLMVRIREGETVLAEKRLAVVLDAGARTRP
jgi:hypothetical protein